MNNLSEKRSFGPEQISVLLKIASARLGKDPIMLRQELENGSYDNILKGVGADKQKLQELLQDKKGLESLLSSPEVKTILKEIIGGQQ